MPWIFSSWLKATGWESRDLRSFYHGKGRQCSVFGKRQRLIQAPRFVPLPSDCEPLATFDEKEVAGKVSWSRVASVIPWPVTQERALARALENWRIIVVDNLEASILGRQIRSILDGTVNDMTVEQVIRDSFAGKSVSTLRSRSSSIMAFARWKKAMDDDAKIFPLSEEQAYRYILELRQLNAPKTQAYKIFGEPDICFPYDWS